MSLSSFFTVKLIMTQSRDSRTQLGDHPVKVLSYLRYSKVLPGKLGSKTNFDQNTPYSLGGHKKSKFLGLISSQVNPIPFLYLRHRVKYFCPNQSGSAALRVVIIQKLKKQKALYFLQLLKFEDSTLLTWVIEIEKNAVSQSLIKNWQN